MLVQVLRQVKAQQKEIESLRQQLERAKLSAHKNKFSANSASNEDDHIEEHIEDHRRQSLASARDPLANSNDHAAVSGGISSSGANAIDHSIDTLQLEQYDYVEEVRLN